MSETPHVGVVCLHCHEEWVKGKEDEECPAGDGVGVLHEWGDPLPWEIGPDSGEPEEESESPDAPDLDLPEILAEEIMRMRPDWDRNGRIYASDLGIALGPEFDGCQLAWWHAVRGPVEQKPETPGSVLMMTVGELLHDYISDLMRTATLRHGWEVVAIEKRAYLEHDGVSIGSRLDVKIRHIETGYTRVVDIKTKRGGAFRYLNEPKEGNVLQVQGYVKAEDADDGSLLYVDREGQNFMKEFIIEREDERPEKAIEILKAIKESDEPPPPCSYTVKRTTNKGPDSVYLNTPWQVEWCRMKECACKQALGGTPPDGIVAKLHEKDGVTEIRLTDAGRRWGDLLLEKLEEAYEDEEFVLAEPTEKKGKKKS